MEGEYSEESFLGVRNSLFKKHARKLMIAKDDVLEEYNVMKFWG